MLCSLFPRAFIHNNMSLFFFFKKKKARGRKALVLRLQWHRFLPPYWPTAFWSFSRETRETLQFAYCSSTQFLVPQQTSRYFHSCTEILPSQLAPALLKTVIVLLDHPQPCRLEAKLQLSSC